MQGYLGREFYIYGINFDIDIGTLPEDLINQGGVYTGFPSTQQQGEINVSGADTGTVYYFYLETPTDTSYKLGVFNISGAGNYNLGHDIYRCNYAYFIGSNPNIANVSNITIRHSSTPTNIFCVIKAGFGRSYCGAYSVPYKKRAYIKQVILTLRNAGYIDCYFKSSKVNESFILNHGMTASIHNSYNENLDYTLFFTEQTDIIPRVMVSTSNNLKAEITYKIYEVSEI